jgi:hypothetical protein
MVLPILFTATLILDNCFWVAPSRLAGAGDYRYYRLLLMGEQLLLVCQHKRQ